MKKTFLIGLKDVKLIFRDRAALITMLLAPFLLTIGLGFVTGRFSGNSGSGISDIPVIVVNQDQAELGNALVETFQSKELADLVEPGVSDSPEAARRAIDDNQAAAAVIIPDGFTESVIPTTRMLDQARSGTQIDQPIVQIEVYANPTSPTSAGVIKAIVDEFVSRVEEGRISGITSMSGIPGVEDMSSQALEDQARRSFEDYDQGGSTAAIALRTSDKGAGAVDFDPLAYMAPGMALMFLMYTVSYGGRTILNEKAQGTLPRLLVSPTTTAQVLGGKVIGIYLSGVIQVGILILASALFFGVKWGDPLGLAALILAAVFGATGWGMLVTSIARTPSQVGTVGSAIMLIFGILGGSFVNIEQLPPAVQWISKITPNAWGLDGFTTLALGGTLADLGKPILALLVMGALLFGVAVFLFGRSNVIKE
jgi:ABC-2 type transport system permease protein